MNTDSSSPAPGEVWLANFGLAAKVRPVLVLSAQSKPDARALVIVVPLTSQIRGLRGEVPLGKLRWLSKPSAVNVQGLASIGMHVLERKLGILGTNLMGAVKAALRDLLDL